MHKKNKSLFLLLIGIICLTILAFSVKWLIDRPYRVQLPSLPDLQTASVPLKEQILLASKNASRNPTSNNLGILGTVYHSSAYYDKAAQCYKMAVKRNKSKWIWSYYLGYLNREMGESKAAIENFITVTKENPKMVLAWYYAGEGFQNLGQNEQAQMVFNKLANLQENNSVSNEVAKTSNFPLNIYAKYQLARIYLNGQQSDLAEKILNEIIRTYPTFGPAYRLLGNFYKTKGDSLLSKEFSLQANDLAELTPPVDPLINRLALISRSELYILKQIDEAEKNAYPEFAVAIVKNALKYIPTNKYLISKAVKLYLKMDMGKEALPFLSKNIQNFNDNFIELKEVGNLLYEKKFYAQALDYYTQATTIKPKDTECQSSIVLCLANKGNKDQALNLMDKLVERQKNNLKILSDGVYIMLVIGEKEKAGFYLTKLKQLAPANPKVQQLSGMMAEQNGKLQEATKLYESSLRTNPKDMATIQALGNILTKQNLWSETIILYKKSLEYYPNEPYLLEKLGTILVSCPDPKYVNFVEGKKISERAFLHKASPTETTISAGKSIATAAAALGDNRTAYLYTEMIIDLAQKGNAPKILLESLVKDLKKYGQ
jgi:tetratricopeptide (TPR) repeat protein